MNQNGSLAVIGSHQSPGRRGPAGSAEQPADGSRPLPSVPVTAVFSTPGSPGSVLTAVGWGARCDISAHLRLPWVLVGCNLVAVGCLFAFCAVHCCLGCMLRQVDGSAVTVSHRVPV